MPAIKIWLSLRQTVQYGIPVIVSAGDNRDTTEVYSPASAELAYTVAASDIRDNYAYFANYGPEINLVAPGVDVESTWFLHGSPEEGDRDTRVMSGSAQATATVCGLAAYFRSLKLGTESPNALYKTLDTYPIDGILKQVKNGSPNKLAQNNFDN